MLIISPFEKRQIRIKKELSKSKNEEVIEMADDIVVGYAHPGGNLDHLLFQNSLLIKKISLLGIQ